MKKKYQVILPLALPLALAFSVFYMLQARIATNTAYNDYLRAAREFEQNDIISDAVASYQAAIAIHPTAEAYLAAGNLYLNMQDYYAAENWYKDELLTAYPTLAETYGFGIKVQLAQGNVREAYKIYDLYNKRKLKSDAVEADIHTVWYAFDLLGDYTDVRDFSNTSNGATAQRGEKWGVINTKGEWLLPAQYQQIGTYSDKTPIVDADGQAYYVDSAGNKKLTPSYFLEKDSDFGQIVTFEDIQSGLVLAYNGEYWNYYDEQSHEKKFGGYKAATVITNGVGAVSKDGVNWALISVDGQELTGFDYQKFVADTKGVICRTNTIIAEKNGVYLLLDKTGHQLNQTNYEQACAFYENTMAAVKKDGRWLFVNENGEETDLGDIEEAKSFSAGVAPARLNGKWGFINQSGEWVIEPQFDGAGAFNAAGTAFVKKGDNKWQLLSLYRFNHS